MSKQCLSPLILPHVLLSSLLLVTLVNLLILEFHKAEMKDVGVCRAGVLKSTNFNPNRKSHMSRGVMRTSISLSIVSCSGVYKHNHGMPRWLDNFSYQIYIGSTDLMFNQGSQQSVTVLQKSFCIKYALIYDYIVHLDQSYCCLYYLYYRFPAHRKYKSQ